MAIPRVDSHLHIWDLARARYSWLTPENTFLYRNFPPHEAAAELARNGFNGAVLVQADDSRAETEYLLHVAQTSPWVFGVAGWIDLNNPPEAMADLERLQAHPKFRGVRHLVHSDPRKDFLDRPTVRASLRAVSRAGLTLDIPDAWPAHCEQAYRVAADNENLIVVIDHLAKPPLGEPDFPEWCESVNRLAQLPNTVAKFSGLRRPGVDFTAEKLGPIWSVALESFGPARMMYGGDWPMTTPYGDYSDTWHVISELLDTVSLAERDQIVGLTATRVYDLNITPND